MSLQDVKIPFLPSCLNCLAWSRDGEIALPTGELLVIMLPKLQKEMDKDTEDATRSQWHTVRFRTNVFSAQEVPELDLAPMFHLSLGEEQSAGIIIALEWSAPGLATYERCAIGVLTSNTYLSLWAPGTNPLSDGQWRRVLIVNHALLEYFTRERLRAEGTADQDAETDKLIARVRSRIRSFAWAQETQSRDPHSPNTTLLAVTNDYNELFLLRISCLSPNAPLAKQEWKADVLSSYSQGAPEALPPSATPNEILSQKSRFISHLSISPWLPQNEKVSYAWLVYVSQGLPIIRWLNHTSDQPTIEEVGLGSIEFLLIAEPINRYQWVDALAWDTEARSGHIFFAWANHEEISIISFPTDYSKFHEFAPRKSPYPLSGLLERGCTSHKILFETWDPVSLSFEPSRSFPDAAVLHASTQLGESLTIEIQTPDPPNIITSSPDHWHTRIQHHGSEFDIRHKLAGATATRIYGVSAAPLTRQMAVCFSLHPADQLEYLTPGKEQSILAFAPQVSDTDRSDKTNVALEDHTTDEERLEPILHTILTLSLSPHAATDSALSRTTLLLALNLITSAHPALSATQALTALGTQAAHRLSSSTPTTLDSVIEECTLCAAPLPFTTLSKTVCINGHMFYRCNPSLVAIQEPGICKTCRVCGRRYLNEVALVRDDEGREGGGVGLGEREGTLIRRLMQGRKCGVCGGKFIELYR